MKKIALFLVIIILLLVIGFMVYAFISIKPLIDQYRLEESEDGSATTVVTDKHPLLTASQEKTLESIGIDPVKLPTTITPAMESCFVSELGQDRVNEIKQGSVPGITDFFKAKSCIAN
jgi:hypothetical protein